MKKKNGGKKTTTKKSKQGQSASLATEKGLCINSKNKMWKNVSTTGCKNAG